MHTKDFLQDPLNYVEKVLLPLQVLTDESPVCDLFFGSELYHRIINMTSSSTQDGWSDSKTTPTSAAPTASYLALIVFWQV